MGEEVLLGETGLRTEVDAAEVRDLGGAPALEPVAALHGLDDPGVHREGLQPAGAEKQDAVGDLFPDPGQADQAGLGLGVGRALGRLQPAGVGREAGGDAGDVAGAEAERASA